MTASSRLSAVLLAAAGAGSSGPPQEAECSSIGGGEQPGGSSSAAGLPAQQGSCTWTGIYQAADGELVLQHPSPGLYVDNACIAGNAEACTHVAKIRTYLLACAVRHVGWLADSPGAART